MRHFFGNLSPGLSFVPIARKNDELFVNAMRRFYDLAQPKFATYCKREKRWGKLRGLDKF
jgi:hypothetical protein